MMHATTDYQQQRDAMVSLQIEARGVKNPSVLDALRKVPRHEFVEPQLWGEAYEDRPLGIGLGQTISQPYIVGLMTEALEPKPGQKILEIGTGSGYQTAVLCELYDTVYTIERHGQLAEHAAQTLNRLGYGNVHTRVGDGTKGWPAEAPFDAIVLTAAGPKIPAPLMNQLNVDHGRLLCPMGEEDRQELVLMHRTPEGIKRVSYGDVRFVPLIGEHGWSGSHSS